ncbi:hypothetical protein HUJ05_010674 [Dendroctonus ponderosae]|nr:hypothetical protein HUJ05_010674 [Dendroctonus ponderosae]
MSKNGTENMKFWHNLARTPRSDNGRNTPRGAPTQRTPRFDDVHDDLERTKMKNVGKSPRSMRSTPRTNMSPHSMSLGDATPLYDENI